MTTTYNVRCRLRKSKEWMYLTEGGLGLRSQGSDFATRAAAEQALGAYVASPVCDCDHFRIDTLPGRATAPAVVVTVQTGDVTSTITRLGEEYTLTSSDGGHGVYDDIDEAAGVMGGMIIVADVLQRKNKL